MGFIPGLQLFLFPSSQQRNEDEEEVKKREDQFHLALMSAAVRVALLSPPLRWIFVFGKLTHHREGF